MSTASIASTAVAGRDRGDAARLLAAGTLAAVLDIIFAALLQISIAGALRPARLLQSIAAGLLGRAAYDGGLPTAALGAVLHFAIACTWAAVYFVAYRRSAGLRRLAGTTRGAVTAGLAFGALVWLVMDLVVLPLSHARPTPVLSGVFLVMLVGHMIVVGLPIALTLRGGRGAATPARRPIAR